jgi:hypothetical protein
MAFELEKFLTDTANSKSVNAVFNNPIYTALIIVSMVLLIIYFTMRNDIVLDEDSDTTMTTLMFTSGIYCILAVLGVVYLQHRSITGDFELKYNVRARDDVVNAAIDGGGNTATLDIFNPQPALQNDDDSAFAEDSSESGSKHNTSASSSERRRQRRKKQQEDSNDPMM